MISLRKHIDTYSGQAPGWVATVFQAVFRAIGDAAQRAMPLPGKDMAATLAEIRRPIEGHVGQSEMESAAQKVIAELDEWAESGLRARMENETQLGEMIALMTHAAESVAERDEKYSRELDVLQDRLRRAAAADNLLTMRRSVCDTAKALSSCVLAMVAESRTSVERLTGEVAEYRARLAESERLSSTDCLTGLANRRAIEWALGGGTAKGAPFSIVMVDLNGFKSVNDRFGHAAGDQLLCEFAQELRAQFGSADLVGRWGGDEFVVVVNGGRAEAEARIERVRRWALGDYRIDCGTESVSVAVDASIGFVEWDGTETAADLLARADRRVYEGKERRARPRTMGCPEAVCADGAGELAATK